MTTSQLETASIIEALELWNRKLARRMQLHPVHQIRMDSLIRFIENMQYIAALRQKQESPERHSEPQLD